MHTSLDEAISVVSYDTLWAMPWHAIWGTEHARGSVPKRKMQLKYTTQFLSLAFQFVLHLQVLSWQHGVAECADPVQL